MMLRLSLLFIFSCLAYAQNMPWQKLVSERLPEYGHRNWIVVADSAYPAQSKPGIETVVVNADQMTVLRGLMQTLAHAKHVSPIAYTDQELQFLEDKETPGVEVFRQQLNALLANKPHEQLPHEQIIGKLDQTSQTFKVLILKTNSALPYTSVFLQLDCAYWGPDAEKRLRDRIAKAGK